MSETFSELDSLYASYASRYTAAELAGRHFSGAHPQPRPEGEVRDRNGAIVLKGRALPLEECHCPTFAERLREEIRIDLERKAGEGVGAAAVVLDTEYIEPRMAESGPAMLEPTTPRGMRVWRLRLLADLGMRRNGHSSFYDDEAKRSYQFHQRVREGVAMYTTSEEEAKLRLEAWDRPMTDDEESYYAKLFDAELAEIQREEIVERLPLD